MKQLTQNQSDAIIQWIEGHTLDDLTEKFKAAFPPACCDSCADGDVCDSEIKEILGRNESEFDSNIIPSE